MKVCAPPVLVLELGRLVARLGHEEEGPHGVEVEHRRLQFSQLDGGDANRPDITEMVVAALALNCSDLQMANDKEILRQCCSSILVYHNLYYCTTTYLQY